MARQGRIYTKDLAIEPRQHELLGLDLGEGPERRTIGFGLVVFALWVAITAPILGVPTQITFTFYILPPSLITWFGRQTSARLPRRRRVTEWVLALRYPLVGAEPIIKLGARSPSDAERLPLSIRWQRWRSGARVLTGVTTPGWVDSVETTHDRHWVGKPSGKPIQLSQHPVLLGTSALAERLAR